MTLTLITLAVTSLMVAHVSCLYGSHPTWGTRHVMCFCQLCNACCSEAEIYLEVLRVNIVGPVLVTKHFLPLLRKSSVRPKIVNISSKTGSLTTCRENRNSPSVSHCWMLQGFLMSQASPQHCSGSHFSCCSRPTLLSLLVHAQ